jgi:hypothetical protein
LDFAMATIPNVRSPRASVPKPTVAVEKVLESVGDACRAVSAARTLR